MSHRPTATDSTSAIAPATTQVRVRRDLGVAAARRAGELTMLLGRPISVADVSSAALEHGLPAVTAADVDKGKRAA